MGGERHQKERGFYQVMPKQIALTKLKRLSKEINLELDQIADNPEKDNPDEILEAIEDLISKLELHQGMYW